MIVFLTTAAHMRPLWSLTGKGFGFDLPEIKVESYEHVVRQPRLPAATYVFCDLERLSSFELRIVASLHQSIAAAGLKTLNDPGRVKLRYELLRELSVRGLNPFDVYRCDDRPRPRRFPVFVRTEGGHFAPSTSLDHNQAELDLTLEALRREGRSGAGMLVVECCPSDRIEGRWFKWGAFGINGKYVLDHIAVDDNWMVKTGRWEQLTPGLVHLENKAVLENRYSDYLSEIFSIAGIDFGRADFALSNGKPLSFEINTNPVIYDLRPDPHLLRCETIGTARRRLAAALFNIDTDKPRMVDVATNPILDYCRRTQPGTMLAPRL